MATETMRPRIKTKEHEFGFFDSSRFALIRSWS